MNTTSFCVHTMIKKICFPPKRHKRSIKTQSKTKRDFIKQLLFIKKHGLNHILIRIQNLKKKIVFHIRNTKQALKHGLKLKKVYRAIAFYQEPWLEPYIDMNKELRKNAKSDFEKDFYKLMNNAVFGKISKI